MRRRLRKSGGPARRRPTWRAFVFSGATQPSFANVGGFLPAGPLVDSQEPVLTLSSMSTPYFTGSSPEKLPLALSPELWEALSPTQRELFERADTLLDAFTPHPDSPQSLEDLVELSGDDADEVLSALRLLDNMALVTVESSDQGPLFSLRATPEEHVRITGPDNKPRWVFIARPVEPRDVDPKTLN